MLTYYETTTERIAFFISMFIYSLISAGAVYLVMSVSFPYTFDNYLLYSIGIFFIGGAVFDSMFRYVQDRDEVTESGIEYLVMFAALFIVLIPVAYVASDIYSIEKVIFWASTFFMGNAGWFVLLSQKTVKRTGRKRIFI